MLILKYSHVQGHLMRVFWENDFVCFSDDSESDIQILSSFIVQIS